MHQKTQRFRNLGLRLGLALLMSILATGCNGKTDKIGEAMEKIEAMDYQGALTAFGQATENKENKRLIARGMGIAHMELGHYEEAIECFLNALSASNGLVEDFDFDVNYYLASAYGYAGRFEEAKAVYDSILALKPKEKDAYYLRGNMEMELDQFAEAKADFDQAVSMDPKNFDRLFAIYEVFAHFGYKEAGQEYLKTAMSNGEKSLNSFNKGRLYYFMEEYQKAYVELEDAKSDDKAESSLFLGKAYEATGDFNYACNVYHSYLEKHGDSAEMYNQLGVCEMKRGNYATALEAFEAGLALQDKSMQQVLLFNEIAAFEYVSDFEMAASLMEEYLKLYPNDADAQREAVFLATRVEKETVESDSETDVAQ